FIGRVDAQPEQSHQQPIAQVVVERVASPGLALTEAGAPLGVGGPLQPAGVRLLEVLPQRVELLLRQPGQRREDVGRLRHVRITDHRSSFSFSIRTSIPYCTTSLLRLRTRRLE